MNLYLLRHANAYDIGEMNIEKDEDRPLNDEGLARVELLARALERFGLTFDRVLTSPLRRAEQTARELVGRMPEPRPEVTLCRPLAPGGSSKKLAKQLLVEDADHVLLVGHEPDLGQHAAWLIGSKESQLEFAKGGMACIRCEGLAGKGAGALGWLVTPRWLGALSGKG